jgi:hypothetical protein
MAGPRASFKEFSMVKKRWSKPELKRIEAGGAESNTVSGNDGAATAPKKS